jgi:hypothetical protein
VLLEPVDEQKPLPWRLVGLVPEAPALARHFDAPMVGRDAELARVVTAFEQAVRDGGGHRLTVLGDAGIGKSRLGREVAAALGSRARILTGHCPPSPASGCTAAGLTHDMIGQGATSQWGVTLGLSQRLC